FVSVAASTKALYALDASGNVHLVNPGSGAIGVRGLQLRPGAQAPLPLPGRRAGAHQGPIGTGLPGQGSIEVDAAENLFTVDVETHRILRVSPAGKIDVVLPRAGHDCCTLPTAIALDPLGNLYISNIFPPQVWYFNRGATSITVHGQSVAPRTAQVVAGSGTVGFGGDGGPALQAQFQRPAGMATDRQGNLYVADPGEQSIRKIDRAGTITTAVGTGMAGFNGDFRKGPVTTLDAPLDLDADPCGNLLIADRGNGRVRRLNIIGDCSAVGAR
ncbi:MAG: hypothetical protein ACRDIU_03050, partial [Actinomycetota bacterium]